MLVSFFRSSRVQVLFVLPLVAILLRLPAFWGIREVPQDGPFLFDLIFGWLKNWPLVSILLSAIITFFEGLLLNSIIQRFDLLRRQNYLTAFFFILFMSLSPTFWFLNSEHLALLFLLLAINKSFELARSENTLGLSFDAAFLMALGTCFFLPFSVFFLLLPIAQVSFSSMGIREFLSTVIGFALPFYLWWGIEFIWVGTEPVFIRNHLSILKFNFSLQPGIWKEQAVLWISLGISFLLSMGSYLKGIQVNTVKTKNTLLLFLWILIFALVSEYIFSAESLSLAVLLSPAVICANYSTYAKKKWIPEAMVTIAVLSAGYTQWTMFG